MAVLKQVADTQRCSTRDDAPSDRAEPEDGTACVYVIGAAEGPQKIGFSCDPLSRLKAFQTRRGARLTVHYTSPALPRRAAQALESAVHFRLTCEGKKVGLELFAVTPEEATASVTDALKGKAPGLTSATSRAARGLLDWTQDQLAKTAGVGITTVRTFEKGASAPVAQNLAAMRRALEAAGVVFISENGGGAGVRMKEPS